MMALWHSVCERGILLMETRAGFPKSRNMALEKGKHFIVTSYTAVTWPVPGSSSNQRNHREPELLAEKLDNDVRHSLRMQALLSYIHIRMLLSQSPYGCQRTIAAWISGDKLRQLQISGEWLNKWGNLNSTALAKAWASRLQWVNFTLWMRSWNQWAEPVWTGFELFKTS